MLRPTMHGDLQSIDLVLQARALKVAAQRGQIAAPRRRVAADDRASLGPLAGTRAFAKIDLLPQAGAGVSAGVAGQGPAHRVLALAVVMHVLLGFIRIVPGELGVDAAVLSAVEANHFGAHDALERMQDRARTEAVERVAPLEPFAQIDSVVVAVGVSEAH